jgi:hypothetical protein
VDSAQARLALAHAAVIVLLVIGYVEAAALEVNWRGLEQPPYIVVTGRADGRGEVVESMPNLEVAAAHPADVFVERHVA